MRHLCQVRHHRVADDVLAQPHGQGGLGFVVNPGAQDLRQLDRLALGVGQLKGHIVFTGYGLDDPNRRQAQAAREVLGQAYDLRSLDTHRRLDFIAGDHRPRRRQNNPHLDAKILELFLDHPAGHVQRLGRHRVLTALRAVEQVDLRQAAVGHLGEQRLLALFCNALALWKIDHQRLYRDRLRMVLLDFNALFDQDIFALSGCLLAERQILYQLALLAARFQPRMHDRANALGDLGPGKTKRQRRSGHAQYDGDQARTGEAQPAHAQRPGQCADNTAAVAWQPQLQAVQPRPLQHTAGDQQQREPQPGRCAARQPVAGASGLRGRGVLRRLLPQPGRQARQPGTQARHAAPPNAETKQVVARVGDTRPEPATPVVHRAAHTRCGPGGIHGRVAQHGHEPESERNRSRNQRHFAGKAGQTRGLRTRLWPGRGVQCVKGIAHASLWRLWQVVRATVRRAISAPATATP